MRPASSLLTSVLPALLARAPLTPEKVDFAWRTVVGDAVARATRTALVDGVLFVSADDRRWLDEVERNRGTILSRLRSLLGGEAVRIIRTRSEVGG
jgi:predicted nucleic acid-binding Zn ribbon protein